MKLLVKYLKIISNVSLSDNPIVKEIYFTQTKAAQIVNDIAENIQETSFILNIVIEV